MKFKHIVFDVDNTILDSENALLTTWKQTINTLLDQHYEVEELRFILGMTGLNAMLHFGITDLPAAYKLWGEYYYTNRQKVEFFPGVIEMLQKMKEAGIELGIITSRKRSEYDAEPLMKLIEPYIGTIVCSDNTPKPKPDGAPVRTYCEMCGITPDEMIYIGDTYNDFMCARNGGCKFGLSQLGIVEKEKIEADYYFDSADDMFKTLV